jgi:sulfite reductase alpha subunit-like flavoprotein
LPSSVLAENLPEIKSRSYSIIADPYAEDIENGIVESFWTTRSVWLAFTYNLFKNAKGEEQEGHCSSFMSNLDKVPIAD